MEYSFGDIIDCRAVPEINHFIVIVGISDTEILYYRLTSRVYNVFTDIVTFFNLCLDENYNKFRRAYPKVKNKINKYGNLYDAVFLDQQTTYNGCLECDSMLLVNKDPERMDTKILNELHSLGKAIYRSKLDKLDHIKTYETLNHSSNISKDALSLVKKSISK